MAETVEQEEVQLTGKLAEFRTALREEIDAARRNAASGAMPLINGRRIAQVGASFQYIFDVENILNLPGDTPGDIYIPNHAPIEVIIISIDGMAITLSVSTDLGTFVPSARLQSNLAHLMRKLIERIEAIADVSNPVGERILECHGITGNIETIDLPKLNSEQRRAVGSSIGRNTTFIWGPPGTGKSWTIGAIGVQLYSRNRSVLLVSHTNTAVDQALLHIVDKLSPEQLADGHVLRVGDSKNERLNNCRDALLETHVAKKTKELTERRGELEKECIEISAKVMELSRQINIYEWLDEAEGDIAIMADNLDDLDALEDRLEEIQDKESRLADRNMFWSQAKTDANRSQNQQAQILEIDEEMRNAKFRKSKMQEDMKSTISILASAESVLTRAQSIENYRERLKELPSLEKQEFQKELISAKEEKSKNCYAKVKERLIEAEDIYEKTTAVGVIIRRWRGLPSPEKQQHVVKDIRSQLQIAISNKEADEASLLETETLYKEVAELTKLLKPFTDVPEVQTQTEVIKNLHKDIDVKQEAIANQEIFIEGAQEAQAEIFVEIEEFKKKYFAPPDEVLAQYTEHREKFKIVTAQLKSIQYQFATDSQEINQLIKSRFLALQGLGLTEEGSGSVCEMFDAIRTAYQKAQKEMDGVDIEKTKADREVSNKQICSLETELHDVGEALKKVEELVISEATIVATTLTRAYLRDAIQKRRFDTVILDEASMAPMPALYVAASRADANAVVVGDYKQLPPIVLSDNDIAKKWLGRDVFEEAGLSGSKQKPSYFVELLQQHRMHPDISAVANTLIYDNKLKDAPETKNDDSLNAWYRKDWGHDNPVLLVDTGSVGAWVTSVARGRGASRLNFLSATICVELVGQLLREGRPKHKEGEKPRSLVVCPYRPHARLLSLLLKDEGLAGEVIAGTVHNFQGSEASVVILDLVCDEPHWKVGMFIPKLDQTTMRLLNVALTRAKHRLIIVGNFDYISKHAKRAFIGAKLIPFLRENYPLVDAKDIVPAGLAAKAAKAQSKVLGGEVEPDADRIVVTQEHFYSILRGDLARARNRIVIFSAFITQNRLGQLEPQLRAALERGVKIFVITKAHSDRNKRELSEYRKLEQTITNWGGVIIHKRGMHEKLIFIDNGILWSGSLNPLSFSNTQEVMERRANQNVVQDYANTIRLEELVDEYCDGTPACPYCGGEIVASEGNDEPFYWRCVENKCYSRSIDAPRIKGGIIACSKCGGQVEYGIWGKHPAWRCTKNRRHHQQMVKTHLRLPKMRAIIPKLQLRKLDKNFEIPPDQVKKSPELKQRSLFD